MPQNTKTGNYRWTVCALIFFATTVNYLDRQVIGILKPLLESDLNIGEAEYGYIVTAFQIAYALGMVIAGRLIDRFGTKIGYGLSVLLWSIAAMGHALAKGGLGFGFWRAFLGISESGNFPAAIKTVAEWFPKRERALATGIFNSGTNVGAIIAPLAVPAIATALGWQAAFIITGAIGLLWLILWFIYYEIPEKQKRLSQGELEFIQSDIEEKDEPAKSIPWVQLLRYRQTWMFFIGKGLTDPIWWFYLFWIPGWLASVRGTGLDIKAFGLPLVVIYTSTTIGSIFGGWLSSFMIKKGMSPFKARKIAMLVFALLVTPIVFAQSPNLSTWGAVGLIALAASSHQAWSANIFTTVSDAFPKSAVSSVTGIGGMAGALGGAFVSILAGNLLEYYKNLGHVETGYVIMFAIAGSAYLVAWIIMQVFAPKNKKVTLE
ncbi:MAG TPA: MFS transporter [Bacteroidales bacterium]|nr:MFS transporter [Bacteroidales bacterium]HNR42545.1 MFS transporter [Bacteroidales bacterium]HPM18822.1 MFS transporter [Bacteroidales bacterium]HPV15896.1 MFS transporter [Bacteroidales bacterium]HQG78111.1 MFS transporter [Bacteroidales bacterium]